MTSSAIPGLGFDSILVRLKVNPHCHLVQQRLCFDSILVRLKAQSSQMNPSHDLCFDSILVRLKATFIYHNPCSNFCFDSILVRLKVDATIGGQIAKGLFRFHTGSIKSQRRCCADFPPILVSIPYWFD